jgi:uncharacterized pyridoxamine 5'-phosphate oxidase family protein
MTLPEVYEFIAPHKLTVVSTVDADGKPESAVVGFALLEDKRLIIATDSTSRKFSNIQTNGSVSLVIGWDKGSTVQIQATATQITDDAELAPLKVEYASKNEFAQRWESKPGVAYFVLKPSWIRYTAVTQMPWLVEEFTSL